MRCFQKQNERRGTIYFASKSRLGPKLYAFSTDFVDKLVDNIKAGGRRRNCLGRFDTVLNSATRGGLSTRAVKRCFVGRFSGRC